MDNNLLLPDLSEFVVAEELPQTHTTGTSAYCTKCNINWSRLHSQDDEANDESYEHCPKCKDDFYLVPVKDGDTYHMGFNGIINNRTKEFLVTETKPFKVRPVKAYDPEEWERKRQEREDIETAAIEAYQQACLTMGEPAARVEYHKALGNVAIAHMMGI